MEQSIGWMYTFFVQHGGKMRIGKNGNFQYRTQNTEWLYGRSFFEVFLLVHGKILNKE